MFDEMQEKCLSRGLGLQYKKQSRRSKEPCSESAIKKRKRKKEKFY